MWCFITDMAYVNPRPQKQHQNSKQQGIHKTAPKQQATRSPQNSTKTASNKESTKQHQNSNQQGVHKTAPKQQATRSPQNSTKTASNKESTKTHSAMSVHSRIELEFGNVFIKIFVRFFKICFCFVLLYNKSLNDCSLGEQWVLFSRASQYFPRLCLGKLNPCSPRDQSSVKC